MHDSAPIETEAHHGGPQVDRRRQPTPMVSRYSFFGGRREGEGRYGITAEGIYIDRYPATLFVLLLSLYALNMLDVIYTLLHIGNGGVELNPVARALLDLGPQAFILVKTLGIGLVLCFICLHTNFRKARFTLMFGLAIYFLLAAYHVITYAIFV